MSTSIAYNQDCMIGMADYPDKYFDLAVIDPPYGIGQNWRKDRTAKFYKHNNNFNNSIPDESFFNEVKRVSKNQIIWGCNYYWNYLPPTNNLIFWDKGKDAITQNGSCGELAYTSFTMYPFIKVDLVWNGFISCEPFNKIHPHQKPIKLYSWIYHHYLPEGGKVIDTHLGSGSNRIAAHKAGNIDFVGYEIDKEYFEAQEKRYREFISQLVLF